jgi:hypothetical protein
MHDQSFEKFCTRVLQTRRVGFGDLRRLQRDGLPGGATSREQIEALMTVDGGIDRADEGWLPFLTATIRAFVLRSAAPLDPDITAWLVRILSAGSARTAAAIAREMVREACCSGEALMELARGRPRQRPIEPQAARDQIEA